MGTVPVAMAPVVAMPASRPPEVATIAHRGGHLRCGQPPLCIAKATSCVGDVACYARQHNNLEPKFKRIKKNPGTGGSPIGADGATAESILNLSLTVLLRRSPGVFLAIIPIPSAKS
ncbi:hypothetical protein BHE74_00034993 [Ensete ventricosum]|nr:hypothetical protein BHE74_00034993 [Ensete ventricosum]